MYVLTPMIIIINNFIAAIINITHNLVIIKYSIYWK